MIGFLVLPRVPFTPAVAIDGKGRSGREAGNNEFRMLIGWADCRVGDIADARGDETRGRFVLIASDMTRVVSERMVEETMGVVVQCGRENVWVFGWVMLALEEEGESKTSFGASERVLIKECMPVVAHSAHFVGVRVAAVGVLDREAARSSVAS